MPQLKIPKIKNISTRFMLMFLTITVIIFMVFSLIISSLFSDKLTEELNMVSSQQLEFASSIMDSAIEEIRSYHFALNKDPKIQEAMRELTENPDAPEFSELQNTLKKAISNLSKGSLNIRSSFAITKDGEILDPLYNQDTYEWLVDENPEFDRFLDSQLTLRLSSPNSFPFHNNEPDSHHLNSTITCFGHLYNTLTYENMGYVAININRQSLFKDMEDVFRDMFASFYVIDENQKVIYSNPTDQAPTPELQQLFSEAYPSQGKQVQIDGTAYMGYSSTISHYPKWKILGFVDYREIYQPIRNIFYTMFLVFFLLILFAAITHYYLAQRITVPIRALKDAMRTVRKGNWPAPLPVTREDEISEILDGFNKMNLSLQKKTAQIQAQQEQVRKNEVALVQSQLDLLESQINPHFIHNTLNTMKYLAKLAHAEKLENLIVSFNALLRTSMSTDNLMIPLSEEVENLYHYMDIQKERYDFPIDFQCDISSEACSVPLPKLILQPLVENSLFHGIAPNDGGTICVKASVADGRLWVTVWDNGTGIQKSRLAILEQRLQPSARGYGGIGIGNVNERLVLSYGASSHLVIESEPGENTSFSFSIPI